ETGGSKRQEKAAQNDLRIERVETENSKADKALVVFHGEVPFHFAVSSAREKAHRHDPQQWNQQKKRDPKQPWPARQRGAPEFLRSRDRFAKYDLPGFLRLQKSLYLNQGLR